ncbi:MAG: nitrite reductase small subunit NirD [Planctomycetaceae bacterium]|nr:nitrite reductase small subunit NirD [Planctomycetaceae bacterium]
MSDSCHNSSKKETLVVIGNGMVGHRFCENLVEYDTQDKYQIVTFCEESRAAYDRVGLTSFFAHRNAEKLMLARLDWYEQHHIDLHIGDRASEIDRDAKVVRSDKGVEIAYDHVVLATGSYPFVPPIPGINKRGVFVYRTIEDLEQIIEYGKKVTHAAVIGGGLLGLEAAKATHDLGLKTSVIEYNGRLMPRQIDEIGSKVLVEKIEDLGVDVLLNKASQEVHGDRVVEKLEFTDGGEIEVGLIIVAAGIRPRDELARESGLEIGERGGVRVNDWLQTSDPNIYAIGEVALHEGMVYGLVAPGYEMAKVVAQNFTGGSESFLGADLSTKLKLMGVDVASFGNYTPDPSDASPIIYHDQFDQVYKKLFFTPDGKRLLGGIFVGDASDYGMLSMLVKSDAPIPCKPHELIAGSQDSSLFGGADSMSATAQVCSCNNVTKQQICDAIEEHGLDSPGAVKACTKAGGGCGGCMPLVTNIFNDEMKRAGKTVVNHLCEHFQYSRTELFALIKLKELKSFHDVLSKYGSGHGCEICKPTIASIVASLWNDHLLETEHQTLQDTNDRFLANIQRDGTYSVVPRVPGGEITPEKLIVLGEVAKEYGLYTKITGGQRVDLFGAPAQHLPEIWERLIDAGFESGHAYGKALRTVKSCVGTTWCRYGVQDAVGSAINIENRYKGIRAPHKIKMAVSGCVRECAEAQGKDVGLVATENGYNLYVCGNGGATPRHAELLAADIDFDTAIRYIDRFLMYYISTADKLTRTSVWCEKLEGGVDHIREVVIEDKLDICDDLESMMQRLIETYQCEWTSVVNDPSKRKWFRQFVNTDETESTLEIIPQRDQQRPADWPSEFVSLEQFENLAREQQQIEQQASDEREWIRVGTTDDFPLGGGATIKYGRSQIAVFNFSSNGDWYATQNMCPHKKAFVLSRGILGDKQGTPKVACPLHKKTFSLKDGRSLQDESYEIRTFPVKVEDNEVHLLLPPTEYLDKILGTEIGAGLAASCETSSPGCNGCSQQSSTGNHEAATVQLK